MISLAQLIAFFGWCSIINIMVLLVATISLSVLTHKVIPIHSRLFDISEQELKLMYFRYLAQYKILTLIFFIVPYLALRIIS